MIRAFQYLLLILSKTAQLYKTTAFEFMIIGL